ncbi:MAG: (2Fe-2S) ferredoxin domain-containing protein [Clostridia bacterium]|nr:(2Fe-2S) ferredoxin domain-containing protein [Clostridia bacterium]
MVTIVICVGSSCFQRGSNEVIDTFKQLIAEHGLTGKVILKGSFCMEHCTSGVTVKIGEEVFTEVYKNDVPTIFSEYVLNKLSSGGG